MAAQTLRETTPCEQCGHVPWSSLPAAVASQASQYDSDSGFPQNAINSDTSGHLKVKNEGGNQCLLTRYGKNQWFKVEFGERLTIAKVKLYNRDSSGKHQQMNGAQVWVGTDKATFNSPVEGLNRRMGGFETGIRSKTSPVFTHKTFGCTSSKGEIPNPSGSGKINLDTWEVIDAVNTGASDGDSNSDGVDVLWLYRDSELEQFLALCEVEIYKRESPSLPYYQTIGGTEHEPQRCEHACIESLSPAAIKGFAHNSDRCSCSAAIDKNRLGIPNKAMCNLFKGDPHTDIPGVSSKYSLVYDTSSDELPVSTHPSSIRIRALSPLYLPFNGEGPCLSAAVAQFGNKVTATRPLQIGEWDANPPGCFVQSGGDWAAHYNRANSSVTQKVGLTRVLSKGPWSLPVNLTAAPQSAPAFQDPTSGGEIGRAHV